MSSIKVGDSFKAVIPFTGNAPVKIHITHVLQSSCYRNRTLIVYKVYGKHKQWWHELMCTETDMMHYIDMI